MSLPKLIITMMEYYNDVRLSEHAIKAYAYASSIAEEEKLSDSDRLVLSAAAILHDIGIPRAIKLYGSSKGEYQEKEGALLVPEMLNRADIKDITEQVAWLVGNHHTEAKAENSLLLQILMEADYLVNLAESSASSEKVKEIYENFFKTDAGKKYIKALFCL